MMSRITIDLKRFARGGPLGFAVSAPTSLSPMRRSQSRPRGPAYRSLYDTENWYDDSQNVEDGEAWGIEDGGEVELEQRRMEWSEMGGVETMTGTDVRCEQDGYGAKEMDDVRVGVSEILYEENPDREIEEVLRVVDNVA